MKKPLQARHWSKHATMSSRLHFTVHAKVPFDIIDAGQTIPDEEGGELASDDLALVEGYRAAQDMLSDAILYAEGIRHQMLQVWDGVRHVGTIPLAGVDLHKPVV